MEEGPKVTTVPTLEEQMINIRKLTTISQPTREKIPLFLGAMGLMFVGLFQYIFFTVQWNDMNKPRFYELLPDHNS